MESCRHELPWASCTGTVPRPHRAAISVPLCFSASGALSTLPDNYSTSGMDHGAHGRHAFEMLLVGRACTVKLRGPTPRSFVGAFVVPGARPVVPARADVPAATPNPNADPRVSF